MEEICYGPKVAHQYRFVKFAQGVLHFHVSLVRASITKSKKKKEKKSHTPYSLSLITLGTSPLISLCKNRSAIDRTLSYRTCKLAFIIAISKVQIPFCTLCKLSKPGLTACMPAGLWPPACWACFRARLFPFPNTARIRMWLSFLWSNTEEIAATPWTGVRTIPCFAALSCHEKHLFLHWEHLVTDRATILKLYFDLRLAASVSKLKKGCVP